MEQIECTKNTIFMGDMNAQIGQPQQGEHLVMGEFGFGKRTRRGQMFIDFCHKQKLKITNTIFRKPTNLRWTWLSPNGRDKNEIDFIATNIPVKVENLEILSNLIHFSDHRMVRMTLTTKKKQSRAQYRQNLQNTIIDFDKFDRDFSNYIQPVEETVETFYNNLESILINCSTTLDTKKRKNTTQSIITEDIIELKKQRHKLKYKDNRTKQEKLQLSSLYRLINKKIEKNLKNHRLKTLHTFIEKTGGVKKAYRKLNNTKQLMTHLCNTSGSAVTNRSDLLKIATNFYKDLYSIPRHEKEMYNISSARNEDPALPFLESEVEFCIKKLKAEKSPGPDGITNDMIIAGKEKLITPLTNLFNLILQQKNIPKQWLCSEITLLYKKGDPKLITNYRPISLMSCFYKVLTSTLLQRITRIIEENQSVEQAGFRKNYSTIDHIHTLKQIMEKYTEYNKPLYIAFIDYSKAFDTISHNSIWKSLMEQGVNNDYIEIIKEIYKNSTARVRLETAGPLFQIKRGVKQGDPLSPKMFIAVLEHIFRQLEWNNMGIKIEGAYLNHLRFADDLVLLTEDPEELQIMIESLSLQSKNIGLEVNQDKTKIMTNRTKKPIEVNSLPLEYVEDYIYLGHLISFKTCTEKEINRRINNTWNKYWAMKDIFKGPLPIKLKTKAMNICLTPCLTYACQTWPLTKKQMEKLRICQRGMERSYMNLKLKDRVKNTFIRKKTKAKDVVKEALKLKWRWTGHTQRLESNRWAQIVTNWVPRDSRRKPGRPHQRWHDDIAQVAGKLWSRTARNRQKWKLLEEAFTARGGPYTEDS